MQVKKSLFSCSVCNCSNSKNSVLKSNFVFRFNCLFENKKTVFNLYLIRIQ